MTHRPSRAALLSLAVFLLGLGGGPVGPSAALAFGRNKVQTRLHDWVVLTTPHFEIHYYGGAEELAVRASLIAEQAYREYADRLDHELARRVPLILYASHSDFAQTNVADDLIGEGTGGFSEPYRNRMVLPYNGSHEEFVHVIRHELVHVFMFDAAFGSSRAATARSPFFSIPLWYAEGIAEWFSSGWDANADMFVRDATINDYLLPLDEVGGYQVYKQGQAAMRLISERYGEEKLVDLWRRVGRSRSVDGALMQTLGLRMRDLDELYAKSLRRRYWPSYADLEEAAEIARPLTDHERGAGFFNARPAISPDGERIAFLSDRDGLISLYLMSALDGRGLRRLAQGQRTSRFESLHGFSSSLAFAPDGREVAFVARSGNEERLLTIDTESGAITRSVRLGLDSAASPAWSPDGRRLALVGTRRGRTDLWLLDLAPDLPACAGAAGPATALADGLRLTRLTDDIGDEGAPAWSPDGRRLAFAFNPRAELDFEFETDAGGRRRLLWARPRDAEGPHGGSLVLLDPATGERSTLWPAAGGRRDPAWIDARTLCVVDESDGIANLALVTLDDSGRGVADERRLTNVLGGLFQPTYAAGADRLVFTAFHAGGYDLYAADDFRARFARREPAGTPPRAVTQELPALVTRKAPPDSVTDAQSVGLIRPYHPRLSIEPSAGFGGGGVYYNSAIGLGVANVITLSDLLGDNRLSLLLNFYGSLSNSDLAASYTYLRRRLNYGCGLFHYKNYYSSVFTSVGELLPTDSFFSERNYGLYGVASYPLSTFRRFDLQLELFRSERTLYQTDPSGFYLVPYDKRTVTLAQPSLSYVHDSAFFGPFGPVTGSRVLLSFAPSLPLSADALDRRTFVADLRRYWMPFRRNTFAVRVIGAASEGRDPRAFVLGGPTTLRGYNIYDFETVTKLSGSRMFLLNAEYRLPLLDYLIFGWPGRWGLTNFGATLFCDVGAAWSGTLRMFGADDRGREALRDLRGDFGFGLRTRLLSLPVRLDWAWKTDLRRSQDPVFHFSIGPEF
ncbi:MAG: BamA/TamA family outer membrane protein [Candidatus Krumholzibacteriia bacterium]